MTNWLENLRILQEAENKNAYNKNLSEARERFEQLKRLKMDLMTAYNAHSLFKVIWVSDEERRFSSLKQLRQIVLKAPERWENSYFHCLRKRSQGIGLNEIEREAAAFILCNWVEFDIFAYYCHENYQDPIELFISELGAHQ